MHCRNSMKFEGWMYINGKIILFFLYWEEEMFIFFKMQLLSLWHIMEHAPPQNCYKMDIYRKYTKKTREFQSFQGKKIQME